MVHAPHVRPETGALMMKGHQSIESRPTRRSRRRCYHDWFVIVLLRQVASAGDAHPPGIAWLKGEQRASAAAGGCSRLSRKLPVLHLHRDRQAMKALAMWRDWTTGAGDVTVRTSRKRLGVRQSSGAFIFFRDRTLLPGGQHLWRA